MATKVIYGSSQTNPNYANFQGSQTFAPKSVTKAPVKNLPFLGTKTNSGSGGNPVGYTSSSGGNSGSSYGQDYMKMYNDELSSFNKAVDDYMNEVIAQSNGDLNFASKWIEAAFTKALGTDDVARAQFIKKVANALEAKVGTIAFDYENDTYRVTSDRDLALSRLNQDEQRLKETANQARETQAGDLNARGILSSTRANAQGLAGKEVGILEGNIGDKFEALRRNRENINIGSERDLADITTGARRAAIGEQNTRDYQTEQAKRINEKNQALARAKASADKATNETYLKQKYFG